MEVVTMSRFQFIGRLMAGIAGICVAAYLVDSIDGAIGWALAGVILAVTLGPSFRLLYAWSTQRALARADRVRKLDGR